MALGAVSLVVIGAGVLVILALLIIFGPKVLRKMQGNQKDGETYAQVPFEHSPETSLSETTAMAESTSHNAAPVHKKHAAKHPAHHAKHPAHKKK